MNYDVALVPGRECGECTLCCQVQNIDKPQVQKASGVLCQLWPFSRCHTETCCS